MVVLQALEDFTVASHCLLKLLLQVLFPLLFAYEQVGRIERLGRRVVVVALLLVSLPVLFLVVIIIIVVLVTIVRGRVRSVKRGVLGNRK
jgi:hypothetical protein